jgi:hypothetical protein
MVQAPKPGMIMAVIRRIHGIGITSRLLALWVPIIHPCWSGSMPVLVEGAAESVSPADVEVWDPVRIGDRFG